MAAALKNRAGSYKNRWVLSAFILLGAVHLFLALANTGSEWMYGHHGWAGARRSLNAKNYLRYGYIESRLGPLDNLGAMKTKGGKPAPRKIYWHHPAAVSLFLSVVFAVFGESPASAKLFFTLLTMLSFVMMVLIFRKFIGDWPTFVAMLLLTFMPLQAGYLNFVNFEIFVIFCALGVIFIYESHREKRRWWKVLLMGVAVLLGAFSTYPIFPFFFCFWVVLTVAELGEGWKRWKLPLLFPIFVLASGFLFVFSIKFMNEWTWEHMYNSLKGLYMHRHTLKQETPHFYVLQYWDYYFRFFNPLVLILSVYWFADLAGRAFLRKWTRGDAYVLCLFMMAFMYWYLLPQAAKIHEFVALYFPPPLAIGAAMALWHLTGFMSYDSRRVKLVLRLILIVTFVATSVPFIWSIRIFPSYKILTPVTKLDSEREYNYFIPYNILARHVKKVTKPDEQVAFFQGFDIRPELWYWLDRNHRVLPRRQNVVDAQKRGSHAFLLVNSDRIGVDLLEYLLKRNNFVFIDHYYAFDLGHHLRSITFLRKNLKEQCALTSYFTSLPHPAYDVEEDLWRMVDLTLKLRGKEEALRVKDALKPKKSGSISEAVAMVNLRKATNGTDDLKELRPRLTKKGGIMFADAIEYLGSNIERRGGRTILRLFFRPSKNIDFDFYIRITADPLHENADLREEIGKKVRKMQFIIPSQMWEEGYVYYAESELLIFPGPYDLRFELVQDVTFQVLNEDGDNNFFPFKCEPMPEHLSGAADSTAVDILGLTSSSPQSAETVENAIRKMPARTVLPWKKLGSDITFIGCMAIPAGEKTWNARMFYYNNAVDGRRLNLSLNAKGAELKSPHSIVVDLGEMEGGRAPGRIFMVEDMLDADPSKLSWTMLFSSPGVRSPLASVKGTIIPLGKGDYGVHLPFQWLYWYGWIK